MHKMNGQSFIAQKMGLKSSQGSETLFSTGVKYLLGQGIGTLQKRRSAHFKAGLRREATLVGEDASDRWKPTLVKAYKDAFSRRRHSSAVISHISEGKRPET
jgi:hypothetical protein